MVAAMVEDVSEEPSTPTPERRLEFASTFDRLIDANLSLTRSNTDLADSVQRLIRAMYVSMAVSTVLVVVAFLHGR